MAALTSGSGVAAAAASDGLQIRVLSNRADLISAGDALVAIDLPDGVDPAAVHVTLAGTDVTDSFAQRPNGRFEALLENLAVGENVLTATAAGVKKDTLTISNHPNGGPVLSGPQVQPWVCQSSAVDKQCNQPPSYSYQYMPTTGAGFQSYDPSNPPSDVATTTTDQGKTVPYIVRVETGYQDRDQYSIAVLYDPSKPFTAWAPQDGFNHKLVITHGASCGIEHQAGTAPSVMDQTALPRGFAVASTALDNAGHNCNLVTQAESLIMVKERLIERYGELRYTIGTGCSGGSLTQQQVANAFPGIYQGILPQCSFPDAWSTGQQLAAYNLLRSYLENPLAWAPGVAWDPVSIGQVEGHPNHVNSIVFDSVYWKDLGVPDDGCAGVPAADDYNAQTNPGGVRCDLADYMINVLGPRSNPEWSPMETKVDHGFGGLPLDNVGVQYGLEPLRKGLITPAQFVDLNAKVGGRDVDIRPTANRFSASPGALHNAYVTGAINSGNHLDKVAIIDLRGPDPGAFHDAYRTWAIRARMEREQGRFPRNHVIWFGHVPLMGGSDYQSKGIVAMDEWLAAVEADKRDLTLAEKLGADRPADVKDRCSNIDGVEAVDVPGVGRVCENSSVQTRFATPHMVAGEGVATDTNKCALKPLVRDDYYPITFTDAQWALLVAAFPTGVCDWNARGIEQQGTIPWRTYQDADGNVIYGGTPLGSAPGGSGAGWTSGSFSTWRQGSNEPTLKQTLKRRAANRRAAHARARSRARSRT